MSQLSMDIVAKWGHCGNTMMVDQGEEARMLQKSEDFFDNVKSLC